jgi:hypothetical protein
VHNGLDAVVDLVEIARRELGVQCARVEKRRRGGTETTALVKIVETQGVALAIFFLVMEETHGNADPEILRHFETNMLLHSLIHDKVPVIHGLHT